MAEKSVFKMNLRLGRGLAALGIRAELNAHLCSHLFTQNTNYVLVYFSYCYHL